MKPSKETLRHYYCVLHKSSEQIGRELGFSGRTIRHYLKEAGFQKEMAERRRTASTGKPPINKGVVLTKRPKLGRYYVTHEGRVTTRARVIMEKCLGRKLGRWEWVHHKDGNPLNDSPDNLEVMSASEHMKHHQPRNRYARS